MIIDHYYWKHNCKHHYTRQVEKKALESYFWKQDKTFSAGNVIVSQNKANIFSIASSAKSSFFNMLFSTSKKQSNFL